MYLLRKFLAFVLLTTALPTVAVSQENELFSGDKWNDLSESMNWARDLPIERLSALPKPQDDQYRAAVRKLAAFVDGPRDAVDEELERIGFDVANQGEPWTRLAPATKVAVAAQRSFAVSHENGETFLAMLSSALAKRFPTAGVIKEVPAIPFSPGRVQFAEIAAEKLPAIPQEFSRIVLRLGSYLSSGGKITEADLAELTPISEHETVRLIAAARDATELLESLLAKSAVHYEAEVGAENVKLAQTQLLASWIKATSKSYPTVKKDAILAPWLDFDPPNEGPGGLVRSIFPNQPKGPSGSGPSAENGISFPSPEPTYSPSNYERTRKIPTAPRDTTGEALKNRPDAGGIKLNSSLSDDSVAIDSILFRQNQPGKWTVVATCDGGEAVFETTATALWCGLNFISPNSSVIEHYPDLKTPENFSALVDCTCSSRSRSAEFGIHPVLDQTPLGLDLIRLDVVVFGLMDAKEDRPKVLDSSGWEELSPQFDILQWYDDEARILVENGKIVIRAKSAPHNHLLRLRFWNDKRQENVPLAEKEVELLRAHYKPLQSAEHFAKLVCLLRWAEKHGKLPQQPSDLFPRVKILPSRLAYTDLYTQSEPVPVN